MGLNDKSIHLIFKIVRILLLGLVGSGPLTMPVNLPGFGHRYESIRPGSSLQAASAAPQDDGTTIRVLVVYTPAARAAAGGVTQMETEIGEALDLLNTSFANSAVNAQVVQRKWFIPRRKTWARC